MNIAILTSSRADYSIYYPLIKMLHEDSFFSVSIVAFGTHLSDKHGYTVRKIIDDGFLVTNTLRTFPEDDSPGSIVRSMARTMSEFTSIWESSDFDIVFCLGDRYEMFAACSSAMPYNVKLAHIHGGEQTLGAIDDAFRHAITHMSSHHFTAAEVYKEKVIKLIGSENNVYNVGSLSIDNLKNLRLLSINEFKDQFGIDLSKPSMLITFHPETVFYERNELYVTELILALEKINDYQLIITMPNADTMGNLIRSRLSDFIEKKGNAFKVESFGMLGYLSCMKHCSLMLGNTSSGYIEASFFSKYVIDLGSRQNGRILTENIHKCAIKQNDILNAIHQFESSSNTNTSKTIDIYGLGNTSEKIIEILKNSND